MSFIDNAVDLLDKAENSFVALLGDAVKAKAYGEVAVLASMAQALAAVVPAHDGRRTSEPGMAPPPAEAVGGPSWMRRRE